MATLGMNRNVDGVLTSADTTTLTIVNSIGAIVVGPVVVVASSAGVYSYDVSLLPPGDYTATWTFEVTGYADDVVVRAFSVDAATANIRGVTLAEIERRVARRVGPFHSLRALDTGSSVSQVIIKKLRSSINIGDYEDMFCLRRGMLSSGTLVTSFNADDRQRIVDTYNSTDGSLTPDYDWTVAPILNELIELHALDPEEELRFAVQDGLRRCYFWDTIQIASVGNLREINLTDLVPWITRKDQVRRIEYGRLGYLPTKAPWFETYNAAGSVYLKTVVPNVGTLRVSALRPHSTLVNGEYSSVGPDSDNDVLYIDSEYAVLAGHLQCWVNFPYRLADLAVQGRQANQQDVANAFTRKSIAITPNEPEFIQNRFQQDDVLDSEQIGNI